MQLELDDKYDELLVEIHDSKSERMGKAFIEKEITNKRPNLKNELNFLIENEFVEFDKKDQAYYLTYEGYEEVEAIKANSNFGAEMMEAEFQHSLLKQEKFENIQVIISAIVLIGFAALMIIGINPAQPLQLEPELLEQVKKDVKLKMDSIKNVINRNEKQ